MLSETNTQVKRVFVSLIYLSYSLEITYNNKGFERGQVYESPIFSPE